MTMATFCGFEKDFSIEKCKSRFNAGEISKDNFGGNSKEYYNPFTRVNKAPELAKKFIEMHKDGIGTTTGGAGTAGYAMIPTYVDSHIWDRTAVLLPMRAMTPRRAIRGLTYDYIPLTAKTGAEWRAENGPRTIATDSYERVSIPVKYLYIDGIISGPAIAAMRGFIDPAQIDLGVKNVSMDEAEEDALINGDASTNPEEPTGLIVGITTNTTNRSGGYPSLPLLRAEQVISFNAKGNANLAVTDASTHEYIKGLLQDFQRNMNPSEGILGFGIPGAFEYNGVMYIKDFYMPQTAAARRILFLDMRFIFFAVLQDRTYEEKYSDVDGWTYQMKEYLTIANVFESSMSQMYGIA